MTEIKIKQLRLENFKCHRSLNLDFMGGNASIYGDNATGKTSIYDALTWLLFGKDSSGNGEKNIEIKPLDASGEVKDHDAITEVEATLQVNGEDVSLRRTYQEVWTTRRGSSEAIYSGNTSEYYIDGVPCKKNAFQDKVNELVSEDTFRMLTSVSYFARDISWQERRAVLFRVAGVQDDADILATNDAFIPLVANMGRLSLEDYKKKLLSEKKGIVGARTEIPARISECEKTIADVKQLDFDAAKAELVTLQNQLEDVTAQIVALEHDSAADQKRLEIREAKMELSNLESENRAYRASQTAGAPNIRDLQRNVTVLASKLESKERTLEVAMNSLPGYDKQVAASRQRWIELNGWTFTGGTCPTCGQNLPAAQRKEAEEAFEAQKKTRLREIEQTANGYKEAKADAEKRIAELKAEVTELKKELSNSEKQLTEAEAAMVEPVDMEQYAENAHSIQMRINVLSGELADILQGSASIREQLLRKKSDIAAQMAEHSAIINKESLLEYSRNRVDQLREDAKKTAEKLEAIESMLFLMDEYSRYKTRFVEDSINGMFRIARFRLFREQANGGVEDRCDVVLDGVPYISVNNGAKINLGIDIINTLSDAYGVKVPLFVDNAESVTKLETSGSQIIRLVVSENDKELRINYEN